MTFQGLSTILKTGVTIHFANPVWEDRFSGTFQSGGNGDREDDDKNGDEGSCKGSLGDRGGQPFSLIGLCPFLVLGEGHLRQPKKTRGYDRTELAQN